MKPVKFNQVNITLAENQPQYQPLPVQFNDELEEQPMTSCWELDAAELAQIAKTGRIYLKQLTFGNPFQPIQPTIFNPFEVIEVGYFKIAGTYVALIPLQDGGFDQISGFDMAAVLSNITSKYLELQPENFCFVEVEIPEGWAPISK